MSLPLEGVRVLDLSRLLPGGFCSLLLADFGAEVLKVEDTGMGDYVRWSPPYYEGAHESARSALFLALNRNKRSIRIDLKNERGREVLLALVRDTTLCSSPSACGAGAPGVGYERCARRIPASCTAISGLRAGSPQARGPATT
jgi:crotonobetainyl-CoA:carnitine CoA-transferase CaiB-like acyl-CoA transferase